ncbi:MAG: CDP-diacylglycerol--glycerol-3-phosphate 3-phosphatidyltransferase [Oscillospiraceae bacterium]|jgi:CDP-diacylglycerol--glycerol-3-phosphate 3-phosphatidyltransferase|nr:CDP-diacylglycerol--glycerol-3-phosphate 3-phosphatidyltransferase [Oscillospiraceae bacterium]
MNFPNQLTLLRAAATPLVLALILARFPFHYLVAALVFGAAALTDLFDGKIARARGLVTNFGKLMDPLADKMLITAALVGLMRQGLCSAWVVFLILLREFAVTSIRLIAAGEGNVIAAARSGKAKTVVQISSVILVLLLREALRFFSEATQIFDWISAALLWAATALTVISGLQIFWANKDHFKEI